MAAIENVVAVAGAWTPLASNVRTGFGRSDEDTVARVTKNLTATAVVWLTDDVGFAAGAAVGDVTTFPWDPASDGTKLEHELEPGETLYCRSAGADQTLRSLRVGR